MDVLGTDEKRKTYGDFLVASQWVRPFCRGRDEQARFLPSTSWNVKNISQTPHVLWPAVLWRGLPSPGSSRVMFSRDKQLRGVLETGDL